MREGLKNRTAPSNWTSIDEFFSFGNHGTIFGLWEVPFYLVAFYAYAYAFSFAFFFIQYFEKRINRIQKRAHWLVCQTHPSSCTCEMFEALRDRRLKAAMKLYTKASLDPRHILHDIIPPRSTRTGRYIQPSSTTSRHCVTFVPFLTSCINQTFIR